MDYGTYGVPRADLGEALQEYIDSESNYIGTTAFPITNVGVESGKYSAIVRETLTARATTRRGDNGAYARVGLKAEDVTFACEENGLEHPISEKVRKRYQSDFDAEMAGAKKIASQLMREQEIRVADLLFDATTWTGSDLYLDTTGTWATVTTNIIGDVETAKEKVFGNTGMEANTLIINRNTLSDILVNTAIVGRVQYAQVATQEAVLNALANIMGLDQILVGKGVYNSKPEGATAFSGTPIWSNSYAMVGYVPADSDPSMPAIGRTFLWTEDSPTNMISESYEEVQTRSTVVRVRQNTDEKRIDPYFGFLL